MAILIPAKSLTGPQGGATGILAGLLQGLAQGMPIGEQLKNQKRRADLAGQEMQLRTAEEKRRQAKEDSDTALGAMMARYDQLARGEDEQGVAPPSDGEPFSPAPPNDPGGNVQGPPVQGLSAGQPGPPSPEMLALIQKAGPTPPEAQYPGQPGMRDLVDRGSFNGPPIDSSQIMRTLPASPSGATVGPGQGMQKLAAGGGAPQQGPPTSPTAGVQGLHPHDKAAIDFVHNYVADPKNRVTFEQSQKIMAAVHQDQQIRAVKQHAQRISSIIDENLNAPNQNKAEGGAYFALDKYGNPDNSGVMAAKHFKDVLSTLDGTDPKHDAAVLDAIEKADLEVRQHASEKNSFAQARMQMIQGAQATAAEIQAQAPDSPAAHQTRKLLNDLQHNVITDEEFRAKRADAEAGTLDIKQDKEKADIENAHLKAENDRLNAMLLKQKVLEGTPEAKAAAEERKIQGEIRIKGAPSGEKPAADRVWAPSDITKANKDIKEQVDAELPELEASKFFGGPTQEEIDKREVERGNRTAQLQAQANIPSAGRSSAPRNGKAPAPAGKDTAQSLWSAFKGGQISKEDLKKRAAAAGLSPDEFKALAGAK